MLSPSYTKLIGPCDFNLVIINDMHACMLVHAAMVELRPLACQLVMESKESKESKEERERGRERTLMKEVCVAKCMAIQSTEAVLGGPAPRCHADQCLWGVGGLHSETSRYYHDMNGHHRHSTGQVPTPPPTFTITLYGHTHRALLT